MKRSQEEKSKSRFGRRLLIALAALATMAVVSFTLFSLPPVRRGLKAKFDDYLVRRLGSGTAVEEVAIGLRSVDLSGVVLPLDQHGSVLRIRHVEISIVPLNMFRSPEQMERMVRSIRISGLEALIYAAASPSSPSADSSWIPRVAVPRVVYYAVSRLDSLKQIALDSAKVILIEPDRVPLTICNLKGTIDRRGEDLFQLTAAGDYLGDSSRTLGLTGRFSPHSRRAEIQLVADAPAGRVPGFDNSLRFVTIGRGRISARLVAVDTAAEIRGAASFDDIRVVTPAGDLRINSLHATLAGDSIGIEPLTMTAPSGAGSMQGSILLRGQGVLELSGKFHADSISTLGGAVGFLPQLDGAVDVSFGVHGGFSSPIADVHVAGSGISVFRKPISDFRAQVNMTRERMHIDSCSFSLPEGAAMIVGDVAFAAQPTCDLRGQFAFASVPSLFGWKSALRTLQFEAAGPVLSPGMNVSFADSNGQHLGEAALHHNGSAWALDVEATDGATSRLELQPKGGTVQVTAENVQHILTLLFPELRTMVTTLEKLDVRFEGDQTGGTLQWDALVRSDSVAVLPQIARDIHFSGRYDRTQPLRVAMSGKWLGTAGDGYPFEGRADLTLTDRVLAIDRVFIDAAGEMKGRIDIPVRTLDLEISVADLDLRRLPLRQVTDGPMGLSGTISGIVKASGSFDQPTWSMDLSMINGSVFGVPGYWLNLSAVGQALSMRVQNFELGRDVRKIMGASGDVDFGRSQIAMTAEVGSARAEDFLLALLGRGGLLSGDLDGRGTVSGSLFRPNVEAQLSVRNGLLFNALHVDEFTASVRTDENSAGERVLRIPQVAFSKTNTYQFAMSADLVPKADGELHAHVEGKGDFLDLVAQLEKSFRTEGSNGELRLDFGGTLSHPRFQGGSLSLAHGLFAYPDATPGPVATDLNIHLAPTGAVQFAELNLRSGEHWIKIETIPDCDSTVAELEPLVIPSPHVCLGVLKVQTGASGFPLHLPGLMKSDWTGTLILGATAGQPITISGHGEQRLLIAGNAELQNSRVTFPLVGRSGRTGSAPRGPRPVEHWLLQRLEEARWNLDVAVGSGDRYNVELTGLKNSSLFGTLRGSPVLGTLADYFDHLSIDALLDPANPPLGIRGTLDEKSFHLNGRASSLRGKVDYLDQTFNIDHVYADFDETNVMPVLEGRASTMGVDTVGRSIPVYLTLYQIDRETGTRQTRGRLNEMTVVLESDANQTPEQVLQLLGYSSNGDVRGRAEQLVASAFARAIGRQWLNPLTRRLERLTLLDEISISSGGGRGSTLARQQRVRAMQDSVQQTSALRFFTGSQVTVGKYLTRDVFFTYTGELSEGSLQLKDRLGFVHSWNLEYRINPLSRDLVLDLAVEYDEVERRRDESVSIKYFFALEP